MLKLNKYLSQLLLATTLFASATSSVSAQESQTKIINTGIGITTGLTILGAATSIAAMSIEKDNFQNWLVDNCSNALHNCQSQISTFRSQEDLRTNFTNISNWSLIIGGVVGISTLFYSFFGSSSTDVMQASVYVTPKSGFITTVWKF